MEKRRGWKHSEIEFIKNNYGKMSVHDIASRLSRSYNSITHKIFKLDLDDPRNWTQQEDRVLIENYEFNPTVWDMFPGRSRAAITQRAGKTFNLSRKCGNYALDWRFFDTITPDSAYVMGFIAADGCVEPKLNRVSISQAKQDSAILYDIRTAMGCHNPICVKRTKNEAALYIHNRHFVEMLEECGIGQKKTLRGIFPTMDSVMEPHFVRGLFDGDGSIYDPGDTRFGRVQFLGSRNMLSQLRVRLIGAGCSSRPQVRKRIVNTHIVSYSAKVDLVIIYHYMYDDACLMLKRKAQTFRQMVRDLLQTEPLLEAKALEKLTRLKSGEPYRGNPESKAAVNY